MSATVVNVLNSEFCKWEMSKPYHVRETKNEKTDTTDRTYYEDLQKLYLIHNC